MKAIKRTVAALLATLMLATSTSFTLAAEEYSDKEAVVVAKVNAAGIMTGTDKGFEPSKTLTRAEAAAIMVRMKGISEATVKQNAGTTLFSDVAASHWASGYINVASNYGIIKGVGANLFAPEKEVSVAEFYTMAVRALNAGQLVDSEGTWPTNYVNFAIENELAEDVAQIYTATATRMTAATIVANTLDADMWAKVNVKSNGEITWGAEEGKTILKDVLKIQELSAVFATIDTKEKEVTYTSLNKGETSLLTKAASYKEVADTCALSEAKVGVTYTVWYNKDNELLGFAEPTTTEAISFAKIKSVTVTHTGNLEDQDYKATGAKIKLDIDGSEKEYDVAVDATFRINNTDVTEDGAKSTTADDDTNLLREFEVKNASFALPVFGTAYLNDEGDVKAIYAESYDQYEVVDEVVNGRILFEGSKINGQTDATAFIKIDEDDEYAVTKNGKAIEIEDIEEGDAIYFYKNTNVGSDNHVKYTIDVCNDTVEGKVTSFNTTGKKVTIDGKAYEWLAGTGLTSNDVVGKNVVLYLNQYGKVTMWKLADDENGNFALISDMKVYRGESTTDNYVVRVKLIGMDGVETDWKEINVDETNTNGVTVAVTTSAATTTGIVKGQLYTYTMKSGKVVLKQATADVVNYASGSELDLTVGNNVKVGSYYVASNAKVFLREEDVKDHFFTLKELDIDDLDTLDDSVVAVGDIDTDENTVEYVIVKDSTVKAEKNWAFVLSEETCSWDEDDDLYGYDYMYSVVYADGTQKDIYSKSDLVLNTNGRIYEFGLDGSKIKNSKALATVTGGTGAAVTGLTDGDFISKLYNNGTISFATMGDGSYVPVAGQFNVAENVIVVKKDNNKYEVSKFDNLDIVSGFAASAGKYPTADDLKDMKSIAEAYTWAATGEDAEIIVIVYNK